MSEQDFDALVNLTCEEWNKAEKAIKHAENIDGEVVNPAIFELRYAGRRLIEALAVKNGDLERAMALLRDAKFDCHRARHDAIDAATSKMVGDLNAAIDFLSASIVLRNFEGFSEYFALLQGVRRKIAESREDRENRDKIYESIQETDLDGLVEQYDRFKACEPLMEAAAKQEKKLQTKNNIFGWGGLFVGGIGIIIGVIGLM